ncbi:Mrp/NBP35 family ATP-binding protein [Halorubrum sp. Atlit-26R]|uniref:Mrp/NBP35 family ATP-binding protein n=1 Tax=Halorubrum sp. Atlit-26R TaxID=2282128 RepID=UPI000EF21A89|nr:Mrp/NBP35 family ATP-binding protein [Halorubrum sp. Atlit-26R]RLM67102.1 MRP family ATP-binding protein [Halorubrum sp. Atlit-26R]
MASTLHNALARVDDPALDNDIVSLGLVGDIEIDGDTAHIPLALGAPHSPAETRITEDVRAVVHEEGYEPSLSVEIHDTTPAGQMDGAPNVVAVSSGKGGVGKSTVSVNLATAMAERGANVGLFDADVYGPNIPRMLGVQNTPGRAEDDETIIPVESHGLKLMSVGFLVADDDPVIWRGAMVNKILTELLHDTKWGNLDYFVVDLPPGTGDVQLTLLQQMGVLGALAVTTPQDISLDNARKSVRMFDKHDTSVLGVVENMSGFLCNECGTQHDVFATGGGQRLADEFDHPLLAKIPLDPSIQESCEVGEPVVTDGDSEPAKAFRDLAEQTMDQVGRERRRSHADGAADLQPEP